MARRPARLWLLACGAAISVGCSGGAPGVAGTDDPVTAPSGVDPAILEPLQAYGPCEDEPVGGSDGTAVEGLHLPDDAVITSTAATGAATSVQGYVPWTPVQLRVWFQQQADLEILEIEDEVFESEALVSDGTHRMFVKAQAVCELGSMLVARVAPESAPDAVPTFEGSPQP